MKLIIIFLGFLISFAAHANTCKFYFSGLNIPKSETIEFSRDLIPGGPVPGFTPPSKLPKTSPRLNSTLLFTYNSSPEAVLVKFIVFVGKDGKIKDIIFQNTKEFPYHADFLLSLEKYKNTSRTELDTLALNSEDRKFFFGSLYTEKDEMQEIQPLYVEFLSHEVLPLNTVATLYKEFSQRLDTDISDLYDVRYKPTFTNKEFSYTNKDFFDSHNIPLAELKKDRTNEVYNPGYTVGIPVFANETNYESLLRSGTVHQSSILILDFVPREIPPIAGVIITQPTAASSHIGLLARMMDVPFVFSTDAFSNSALQKNEGKEIFLKTTNTLSKSYEIITGLDETTLNTLRTSKSKSVSRQPTIDTTRSEILETSQLQLKDIEAYGAKATNLGFLKRTLPQNVDADSFGLPIYWYQKFITQARTKNGPSLKDFVEAELQKISQPGTLLPEIKDSLARIRKQFEKSSIDPAFFAGLHQEFTKKFPGQQERLKIRSSSNAEDLKEFNGAGLYESKGAWLSGAPEKEKHQTLERALRIVWGSLFTDRAYLARKQFKIQEENVGMGVLVQRAIRDELANGVTIESNMESGLLEVEITSFPQDVLVTNPPSGKIPEVVKVTLDPSNLSEQPSVTIIQNTSELPGKRTILHNNEYIQMAQDVARVYQNWYRPEEAPILDLEWKLVERNGQRKLLYKQVREVPKPTQTLKDSLFLFEPEIQVNVSYYEQLMVSLQMIGPQKVFFEMESTNLSQLKQGISPIKNIRILTNQGIIPATGGRVLKYTEGASWHNLTFTSFTVELTTAEFGPMTLFFEIGLNRNEKTGDLIPQVYDFSNFQTVSLQINPRHFFAADPLQMSDKLALQLFKNPDSLPVVHKKEKSFKVEYQGLQAEGFGEYLLYGMMDKTYPLDIHEVTISGLTAQPFVLKGSENFYFGAIHHNFVEQIGIDVRSAPGLDPLVKKELLGKNIKYIVIELDSRNNRILYF